MEKESLKGYVTHIKYRNEKNGYTILTLETEEDDVVCVGSFSAVSEGDHLEVFGSYTVHTVYGEQFLMERYEVKEPENALAM